MADVERAEVAQIIGWLKGPSHSVLMLDELGNSGGEPIILHTACVKYDERVERLWSLVMGGGDEES